MVNHGIPISVMNNLLECVRQFHEQPKELKMEFYSLDFKRRVNYYSSGDLYATKIAHWRDSISCDFEDSIINLEGLPLVFAEFTGTQVGE